MGLIQGSEEWFKERLGLATASCFGDVLAKGAGKTREAYKRRLVCERLTGKPLESFSNSHTDRGNEQEPFARMAYEAVTGGIVDEVGFIRHKEFMAGASPDGLIGDDGGIEIKSVLPTVQVETIERGGFPPIHRPQIQGCMWVTGRKWWDFVSFSPDMPKKHRLYIYRVNRDVAYISNLRNEIIKFLCEVEEMYKPYMEKN